MSEGKLKVERAGKEDRKMEESMKRGEKSKRERGRKEGRKTRRQEGRYESRIGGKGERYGGKNRGREE